MVINSTGLCFVNGEHRVSTGHTPKVLGDEHVGLYSTNAVIPNRGSKVTSDLNVSRIWAFVFVTG